MYKQSRSTKAILITALSIYISVAYQNCSPVKFATPAEGVIEPKSICGEIGIRAKTPTTLKINEIGNFDVISLPRPQKANWHFDDDPTDLNHSKVQASDLSVQHMFTKSGVYNGWVKNEFDCEYDFQVIVENDACFPAPPVLPINPIQITSPQNVTVSDIHNPILFSIFIDSAVEIDVTKGVNVSIYSGSSKVADIAAVAKKDASGAIIANQFVAQYTFANPGSYIVTASVIDTRYCIGELHQQITFNISCPTSTSVNNLTYEIFDSNNKIVSSIVTGSNLLKVKDATAFVSDSFLWKFGDNTPNAGPGSFAQVTHTFAAPAVTANGYWIEVSANDKTCNSNFVKSDLICKSGFDKYNGNLCISPCVVSGQTHMGSDGTCSCPIGQEIFNNKCVNVCTIAGQSHSMPDGACACQAGQEVFNNKCVNVCTIVGQTHTMPDGACACQAGQEIYGNTCVNVCTIPGQVHTPPNGACACQAGQELFNNQCVNSCTVTGQTHTLPDGKCDCPTEKPDIVNNTCSPACTNGYTRNAAGQCVCPSQVLDSQNQCCPQANVVNGQCINTVTTQDVTVSAQSNNQVVSLYMIIDNSLSMNQHQTQLSSGMNKLLTSLNGKGYNLDLKLYTTTVDGGNDINTNTTKGTSQNISSPENKNQQYYDYDQKKWITGTIDTNTAESKGWSQMLISWDNVRRKLANPFNNGYNLSVRSNTDTTTFSNFVTNATTAIQKIGTSGSQHEDAICTIAHIMAQSQNLGEKAAFLILSDENRDNYDSRIKSGLDKCFNINYNYSQQWNKNYNPVQYVYQGTVSYTQQGQTSIPASYTLEKIISQWQSNSYACISNNASTTTSCTHYTQQCQTWNDGQCVRYQDVCDAWAACPNGYISQGGGQCIKYQYSCQNNLNTFYADSNCSNACETVCTCGGQRVDCSTQSQCADSKTDTNYSNQNINDYPYYYSYNYRNDANFSCTSGVNTCTPAMLDALNSYYCTGFATNKCYVKDCSFTCSVAPDSTQQVSFYNTLSDNTSYKCPVAGVDADDCSANSNNSAICSWSNLTTPQKITSCSVTPVGGNYSWNITNTSTKTQYATDILAANGVSTATKVNQIVVDKLNSLYPKDVNGNPGYFVSAIVNRNSTDMAQCTQNVNASVGTEYLNFASLSAKSVTNPICTSDYTGALDPLATWMQDIISNTISFALNPGEVVVWIKLNGAIVPSTSYSVDLNAKTITFQTGMLHKNDVVTIATGLKK